MMMRPKWFSKFCLKNNNFMNIVKQLKKYCREMSVTSPPSPNYCQQHYIFIPLAHINKELNPKIIHVNSIVLCLLWVSYYINVFYGSRLVSQAHWTSWKDCLSNFYFKCQSQLSDSWCCHFIIFSNALQFPMFSSTFVCNKCIFWHWK
jgi:hypothetical protein